MTREEQVKMLNNIADALTKQDEIMEKLDDVMDGLDEIKQQLRATHAGHEEELWGKEFPIDELLEKEVEYLGIPDEEE